MRRTVIGRMPHMQGDVAKVGPTEDVTTFDAGDYLEIHAGDYVLAQARLILGTISEEDAKQLLAAEHELQHLFEALAREDEDG